MAALIRGGDIDRAVEVACSRFAMARAPLMRMDAPWAVIDPERLLAALLFLFPTLTEPRSSGAGCARNVKQLR